MALDPNIIGGIRPIQIESPINLLTQALRVKGMQQESQLGQAKLDEYTRTKTRQNAMQTLLQSLKPDASDEDRVKTIRGGGFFDEADKLETGMLNRQKVGAEVKAKEWEAQSKKLDFVGQAFNYVRQNPTLEAANQVLDYLGQNGIYTPETVAQYKQSLANDPTKIAGLADMAFRTALGAKEQLASFQTRNTGGSTDTVSIDPVSGQAKVVNSVKNTVSPEAILQADTARRGQNMNDARSREQIALGKVPTGYRQQADGSLVAIPGGPADPNSPMGKQPTEFQGKSAVFGARAEQADKIISGLDGKYSPAAINSKNTVEKTWLVGGALGAATNKFGLSESDQKAEQAQRDFINAVLRQESGAAIGADEFDNARKQYFPQPGDSQGVIKQKADNRKVAIQGFKNNAGRAGFTADLPAAPPSQSGITFLGFE